MSGNILALVFETWPDPSSARTLKMQNAFSRPSHTPGRVLATGPALGQHNRDMLAGLVGYGHERIASGAVSATHAGPAFARSILRLLGLDLSVPDQSTLSRRGRAFVGRCPRVPGDPGSIHLVLDSTGLELFGEGEWNAEKHGRTRLTDSRADEAMQVPLLLRDVEGHTASVTANGVSDGSPTYQAVAARHRPAPPDVMVPPRASVLLSTDHPKAQGPRDRHLRLMAKRGLGRQLATGYGRRNHAETTMGRYKHLIGPKLRARTLPGQRGEVTITFSVVNRMIRTESLSPFAHTKPPRVGASYVPHILSATTKRGLKPFGLATAFSVWSKVAMSGAGNVRYRNSRIAG